MLDLLTSDEIRKIVTSTFDTENVDVCDYSIKPMSDKLIGFLGEHFRLTVNVLVNSKKYTKSYFIKTLPRNNPKQCEYVTSSGAFKKEVECYDKLFRDINEAVIENKSRGEWHPKYYYGRDDIIVLEDLTPCGFKLFEEREPLDLEHAKLVLKTLAMMHGECLVFEEKVSTGKATSVSLNWEKIKHLKKVEIKDLYPLATKEVVYNLNEPENTFTKWMKIGPYEIGKGISEALDGYNESERLKIKNELPKIILEIYPLTEYSTKFKNIFTQGDGWTNNFLFRYENDKPVEARILDYQLSRYIPPVHDLLEILYITVTRELRERHEKELTKYYYSELKKVVESHGCDLDKIISWDSFLESLEYYRKLGLARASILLNIVLTPPEVIEEGFATIEEYEKFILNERGDYIKKCFQYESYKKRNSDMFHELIQRYIL